MSKPEAPPAPARKRVRPPAVKRDPVIAALIAKLPAEGGQLNRAQRANWLRQVAMAFDGAYGVLPAIAIDASAETIISGGPAKVSSIQEPSAPPPPISAAAEPDEIRYYVDAEGFARKEPGRTRIRPVEIPNGCELEDERVDDDSLDTIKWADGVWPPGAYPRPITIVKA